MAVSEQRSRSRSLTVNRRRYDPKLVGNSQRSKGTTEYDLRKYSSIYGEVTQVIQVMQSVNESALLSLDQYENTLHNEIASAQTKLSKITPRLREMIAGLPEGVTINQNAWTFDETNLSLVIAHDDNRPWRGLNGTAGLVFQLRKMFGIPKFERQTLQYGGILEATVFSGYAAYDPNDPQKVTSLTVKCVADMPPTCQLVPITETKDVTRYEVRCRVGDPVSVNSMQREHETAAVV